MVKKKKSESTVADLLRISNFVLLNTLVFHEVLHNQRAEIKSLNSIHADLQRQLLRQWDFIENEIDYAPIFRLAKQVLSAYPSSPQTEAALAKLKDLALSTVSSGVHLRHDLMGRIYHKLLLRTTGGYYATYYTSIPAAVLLSDLQLKTLNPSWNFADLGFVSEFRLIDPACGSGTLLSSSYSAIRDKFIIDHANTTSDELAGLHRAMLEDVVSGFDVLDYATHLSLTTLALHNPLAPFSNSNIFTLPNGVGGEGKVYLGSLDSLDPQGTLQPRRWGVQEDLRPSSEGEVYQPILLESSSFDVVVMNPPFSRSANPNLKFGYADPDVRKKMGNRLKRITKELRLEGIGVAGLGAHFMALGDRLLRPNGRIGVVIPRSILAGVSWGKIRSIFEDSYEIEYVVSNFDPSAIGSMKGWGWSENTDLGEVLVIARKEERLGTDRKTLFVNVVESPANEVESLLFGQLVRRERSNLRKTLLENTWAELASDEGLKGYCYWVNHSDLRPNWHLPCLFANPELNRFAMRTYHNPKLLKLGSLLSSSGRDIAMVKKHFAKSTTTTTYAILYGHQSSMNTILLPKENIGFGRPKSGKKSAELHRNHASSFLIAERPHTNSENLLAVEVPTKVLATAFWEVKLSDPRFNRLLLLWLNSTFGFVLTLGSGSNSRGSIFKVKQDHLRDIPVPDPADVSLDEVADLYNSVRSKPFHRFADEFALAANNEGVRREIDDWFIEQLGLDVDLENFYPLIAEEHALE